MLHRAELLHRFCGPGGRSIGNFSSRRGFLWMLRGGGIFGRGSGCGWRLDLGRSLGQGFLDKSWGDDGRQNRAVSSLFDYEAVEEGFYVRVCALRAHATFGRVKDAEKCGGLFGDGLCVGVGVGEGFRAQVQSAKITRGNHGYRRFWKQEAPAAEAAEGTYLGPHAQNREGQAG